MRINDTINPYNANASPKIKIKIIPTNILSCCAFALTPASPTIPIASPAAYNNNFLTNELNPQHKPEAKCAYAAFAEYFSPGTKINKILYFFEQ